MHNIDTKPPKSTYESWEYAYNNNGSLFSVCPQDTIEKPKRFFKYYAVNNNSIEALTHYYIYATHPNLFNDSIDCNSQILDFSECHNDILKDLYESKYNDFFAFAGNETNLREITSEISKTIFYKHIGIISLATNNKNVTLWNNYTDCRGFCIEFDIDYFPFQKYGPFPVHYVEEIKKVKVTTNIQVPLLIQTNIKTKDWEKEQEWRLIVSNPEGYDFTYFEEDRSYSTRFNTGDECDRKMRYPINAIKSVTLGDCFFNEKNIKHYPVCDNEEEIVFLHAAQSPQCKILDFIIGKDFPIYFAKNELGKIHTYKICITKLQDEVYRIISIQDTIINS